MNKTIASAIVAVLASTAIAAAESDSRSRAYGAASAMANAQSASQSLSGAQSNNSIVFNSPGRTQSTVEYKGDYTVRSAPQVSAPSMSSGHPCAFAPLSVGISVIGFGGAFGGQRIDDACMLGQMGVTDASISMIAARNKQACRALESVGRIPAGYCGGARSRPSVQPAAVAPRQVNRTTQTTQATRVAGSPRQISIPAGSVNCVKNSAGRVVRVEHWARVPEATARRYCRQ